MPHFLICYEESPACKRILSYLKTLFQGGDLEITFLHLVNIPASFLLPKRDYLAELKKEEELERFCEEEKLKVLECFERAVKDLREALSVKPHFEVRFTESDRIEALLQFLQEKDFTAILAGKRGLGRLAGLFAGSFTQKLILYTDKPLWIIRGENFNQRLLLAFDLGESAFKMTKYLAEILPFISEAEVLFLHVLPFLGKTLNFQGKLKDIETFELEKDLKETLSEMKKILLEKGLSLERVSFKITTSFLGPTYKILKEAKKEDYKTVILGKRGRGGFKGLLLGSTATKVLNTLEDRAVWLIT